MSNQARRLTSIDICHSYLISQLFHQLNRNRKLFLSAVGLFTFDWDKERIKLEESVQEFFNEFERFECLKSQATFVKDGTKQEFKECLELNSQSQNEYRLNDLESWEFYV